MGGEPQTTAPAPRIPPGGPAETGHLNYALARLIGAAAGGGPPNVMTTIARHRGLFRRSLRPPRP